MDGEGNRDPDTGDRRYDDRREAGRVLAGAVGTWLAQHASGDGGATSSSIVLGLPRGGVPVADEVARALNAPLDVIVVRKLGTPRQPELAMGAIASAGDAVVRVENRDIVDYISSLGTSQEEMDRVEAAEMAELRRRQAEHRRGLPDLDLAGRTAIIVDDGLATGATMLAAAGAARNAGADRVIVAVPVALSGALQKLAGAADHVVCPWEAPDLAGVGGAYLRFDQTEDEEVREILSRSGAPRGTEATRGER